MALALPGLLAAAPLCPTDRIDEHAQIAHVYDGDTIRLKDGRKVRLIGFDAPEVGHEGKPSQPYGEKARLTLEQKLRGAERVGLRFGADREDRYGRVLAHVFLPNGSDVTATMLAAGLGSKLSVPPNVWNQTCYDAAESEAQRNNAGVWSLPAYDGVEASSLTLADVGFHRVFGRVVRVGDSRKSVWVELEGRLTIRIPREHLGDFTRDPHTFVGKRVLARGRIYADDKNGLLLTVHDDSGLHPLKP